MKSLLALSISLITIGAVSDLAQAQQTGSVRRRAVRGQLPDPPVTISVNDDFRNGPLGWQAGFADYSPANDQDGSMELEGRIKPLPPELNIPGTGFFFRGRNHSDDLFMFMKKKLTTGDRVRPLARYEASFRIVLASNAGAGCGGIGGAPGESVYLKTGATAKEPLVLLQADDHYRMNVDIGNQSIGGLDASVAGNISTTSSDCRGDSPFMTIERSHVHPHAVTANQFGELWLLTGTDSGFEGITSLYYQSISVTLRPLP